MLPGAIELTLIPCGASSTASAFVSCSTAPFVAQYAAEFGNATCPAIEETKMTELSRFRWGSAAWVSAYGARTFTRHCMSKSSSGAPPNGVGQKIPAECTTESIEPKAERD